MRKVLVVGIIILFLGISIIPIAGSISKQKQAIQESLPVLYPNGETSGVSLIDIKVAGEMGLNNWYISNVGFNFTKVSNDIAIIKYQINDGPVETYNDSFNITEDREKNYLEWWSFDHEGNGSDKDGPFIFNIDQTPPVATLSYEIIGGNWWQGWDFIFRAEATDATSGMERVEFYLNDVLQETLYGSGPIYEWEFKYWSWLKITIGVIAYDNAGHSELAGFLSGLNNCDILIPSLSYMESSKDRSVQRFTNDASSEDVENIYNKVTEKVLSYEKMGGGFDPTYNIIIFHRTLANNGWMNCNASLCFQYEYSRIDKVYYQIDNGEWMLYTDPLVISDDGIHVYSWYVVDHEGNTSNIDSMFFRMDQTSPYIIDIKKEKLARNEYKFTANVSDETSGIDRVKFRSRTYGGSGREFVDYDYPYEWIVDEFRIRWITVVAFDKAGNHVSETNEISFYRFSNSFLSIPYFKFYKNTAKEPYDIEV